MNIEQKVKPLEIQGRWIGPNFPAFIIAEMSANHGHDFKKSVKILEAAKKAGADAIKLQTYKPETMTIDCDSECFKIPDKSVWAGQTLYKLYEKAWTPWEWQVELKKIAESLGLICFSSPFDLTAVDFLESIKMPAYKIASFELVDTPLIEYIAQKKMPVVLSTGMGSLEEIENAVKILKKHGCDFALLKCTSAYPAPENEINLKTIADLSSRFQVPIGYSDHTIGKDAAVTAVAVGACIIEKHLILSRQDGGPDSHFSAEPNEFEEMVRSIRATETRLGKIHYGPTKSESENIIFRRSLFAIQNIAEGEKFTKENIRSIRPAMGLSPKHYQSLLGKHTSCTIKRGTPLTFDMIHLNEQKVADAAQK